MKSIGIPNRQVYSVEIEFHVASFRRPLRSLSRIPKRTPKVPVDYGKWYYVLLGVYLG